jgi:branched-chain amino acid transport system permease protein
MLTLGGVGRLYGALVGAPVYMIIRHLAAEWNPYHWMFVVGFLLIFVMRFSRGGLVGMAGALGGRLRPMLMRAPQRAPMAQEQPVSAAPRGAGAETAG